MNLKHDYSLKSNNTFGLDAIASAFIEVERVETLEELRAENAFSSKHLVLGEGSNILLVDDFDGLVLHNKLKGKAVQKSYENEVIVRFAAGEIWHDCVLWALDQGFGGIENLSLIPGTAGAAPMQNIGAYGVEIKDVFHELTAFNKSTGEVETFSALACEFEYRESVFKKEKKDRFIILSLSLKLTKSMHKLNLNYGAIKETLLLSQIDSPSIQDVSKAVCDIRSAKLPDPRMIGNSGSFFKNPIVATSFANILKEQFDDMPIYKMSETESKIAAGWLIEKCGWKGKRIGDTGSHVNQALVLVNYGKAKGADIWKLAQDIRVSIRDHFGIDLIPEVNMIS